MTMGTPKPGTPAGALLFALASIIATFAAAFAAMAWLWDLWIARIDRQEKP